MCVLYDAAAIVLFHLLGVTHDEVSPALLTMNVLGLFELVFLVHSCLMLLRGALVALVFPPSRVSQSVQGYEFGAMCLSAYLTFALAQFCGVCGVVSLFFFFEFMLEHYYVYNLSVDSKVAWKEASMTLAHLSVTSSAAGSMWSALCPCGASVSTSGWCCPFSMCPTSWLCTSCRFSRCRSCFLRCFPSSWYRS